MAQKGTSTASGSSAGGGSSAEGEGITTPRAAGGGRSSQGSLLKEVLRKFSVEKFNGDGYDD